MSRDVDPLLERINGVLAECDASDMPPLAAYVGFDEEPRPEPMRGWLDRWIRRVRR